MAHTTGPWKWEKYYCGLYNANNDAVLDYQSYEGMGIGGKSDEQEIANACLIAAAPNLLEALEMVKSRWDQFCDGPLSELERADYKTVSSAIAKAKGEQL